MHTTKIAAVALASTAMVAGVASAAVAGHGTGDGSVAPTGSHARPLTVQPHVAATAAHILKGTYLSQGPGGGALAAGFKAVDGLTTINCAKTCYIDGEESVQQQSTVENNRFGLTLSVDGVVQTTPYLGYAPTTTYGGTTWHTVSGPLAKGTHTVQTMIYSEQGTTVSNYSNVYHVFQP